MPMRSEATVGEFERYERLEDTSGRAGFQSEYQECLVALASQPSCMATPSGGPSHSGVEWVDDIFGVYPPELSNDVNFVEILIRLPRTLFSTENVQRNSPAHICHMTVSNLLSLSLVLIPRPRTHTFGVRERDYLCLV